MDIAFKSLYIKFTYKNNIQLMTSETERPRVLVQALEPVPVVQTPVFVPVEATLPELPRDLQNPVVVSPVVRLFSLYTPF
jgi:hypothetical protein